jgi:Ca-activated chloride channel family protein
VTTTSFPESPLTLDRNALPKEEAEITTFEEDLLVDSVKAGQPPATKDSPQWRGQVAPDPASGAFGRLAAKETYRASGDSASPSTPKARDGSAPFDQSGAGGGGGKTAYKIPPAGSSRPSSPAPGPAATGTDPSTGSPAAKSREELGLASAGKREARLEDRKAEPEGKAKGDESAKKLAELQQKQVPATPADGGDDRFSFAGQGQNPVLADEPQVRLRRLLERAKNAEAERSARLAGTVPSPSAPRAGWAGLDGDDRDDEASLRELYFKLTPEQRAQLIEQECRRVFDGCRRLPDERPRDMYFRYWGDNPFEITALDPLSTFSADVDTASYALARRYLVEGKLPEKAQIRTEEFVNYFKADVAAPTKGVFAIHTDLAPSRFAQPANSTWTLRVVVRGKELAKEERKPLHLTCVIDCSGSMREQNRMETVKDTLRLLLAQLNSADMVGIVAFSTEARQILPLTSVGNRGLIEVAIQQLAPDGWTNSEAGLKLGYETALAGLDAQATNRVVFLSDGVANQGVTDPTALSETLRPIREKGVYLNTIGVGMNNHNDALLEQLADKGDGMCSYVDDMREAKHVMMDNFMGSVETIARDVKIQVDFDPAQVAKYRLLGYENRSIADADFRNDKVDAGEVGAGHQVTALYEIERNLGAASEKPLATVRLRYKAPRIVNGPANEEATEIKAEVLGSKQTSFEGSDAGYRRAVIVGQFAEFLRRSVHARGRSLDELLAEAHKLEAQLPQDAEFREFVALAERSKQLVLSNLPGCDELCQAIDAYRTWQFQCAQAERLSHERQQQIVEDLARQNRDMEEKIRELLRRRLENSPR